MKTLEDQIRDYAGFVDDETHTYEALSVERRMQNVARSLVKPTELKKRKRTLALVALIAAGSASTFGVATQFAIGPKSQEVRFLPLSATEQGHFAPSYLPAEFETKTIRKTTDTSGEYVKIMIFGQITANDRIAKGLFAAQVKIEIPDEHVVGKIERKQINGRTVRFDSQQDSGVGLRNASVPVDGCGFLQLSTLSPATQEELLSYVDNFSCSGGQLLGHAPEGMEFLYDAPWTEGAATAFSVDYQRPLDGQIVFTQPSNSYPPELYALLNRFDEMLGTNTMREQLGGRMVTVSFDPRSKFTAYRWNQENAQLMINTSPDVSKDEAERVIASVHKLTDDEWKAMLSAHPMVFTKIVAGKPAIIDSPVE